VRTIDGAFASQLRVRSPNGIGVQHFTTDAAGEMFVVESMPDSSTAVAVYNHLAQDLAPSVRSFTLFTPPNYPGPVCAAPDGTLFGVEEPSANAPGTPSVIFAVPPGGSSIARTFGSFTDAVTALSCEASGLVYVALQTPNRTSTRVEVYSANANGAVSPLWTLTDPVPASDPGGKVISSLALSPGAAPTIPGPTMSRSSGAFRRTGPHGGRMLTP